MNEPSINSSATNDMPRCQHRTRTGRRCRHAVSSTKSGLCSTHTPAHSSRLEESDLSASLTAGLTDFKSAVTISEFLSRLLRLQAEDRISPRRAAVMAYTANLILRTLPAIEKELYPNGEWPELGDLPRPPNTWRVPPTQPDTSRNAPGLGISISGQPSPIRQT